MGAYDHPSIPSSSLLKTSSPRIYAHPASPPFPSRVCSLSGSLFRTCPLSTLSRSHHPLTLKCSRFILSFPLVCTETSHRCESEVALSLTAVGMVVGQPEGAGAGAGARETPPWRNDKTEGCSRQSAVGRLVSSKPHRCASRHHPAPLRPMTRRNWRRGLPRPGRRRPQYPQQPVPPGLPLYPDAGDDLVGAGRRFRRHL